MSGWKNLTKGLLRENPVLVLLLGTCPTLATTTQAVTGIGMGLATTFVLVNLLVDLIYALVDPRIKYD